MRHVTTSNVELTDFAQMYPRTVLYIHVLQATKARELTFLKITQEIVYHKSETHKILWMTNAMCI